MAQQAEKILIIGPAWVGDMVMSQTLYMQLKQQRDCIIDVLAPAWTNPLLERMPEVRKAIAMPLGHGQLALKTRYQLGKSLRAEKYDQAIVLPNSFKSALVPFWAKIPKRTSWLGEFRYGVLNDVRYLKKQQLPLMIERFIALGLPKGAPLPQPLPKPELQISPETVKLALAKHVPNYDGNKPVLALCPGAEFGPSKRWPENYYADVAKEKLAEGWQVLLFGSKNDQPVAADIQQACDNQCTDLTGKTALAEAIDLLSLAAVVVTNDSGLMHIAAALTRPVVVMYGSSSPGFTPPLTDQVKILQENLSCSPCFQRTCPLKHHNCMQQLKPQRVSNAINELLAN